jgi:hypothetical protein
VKRYSLHFGASAAALSSVLGHVALAAGLLALGACGGTKDVEEMSLLAPMALDEHIAWFDRTGEQALFLDVSRSRPAPEVKRVELKAEPLLVQRRNGSNELLALAFEDEKETMELLAVAPKGVTRRYDLETRWNTVTQSDDGRYAIVHYGQNASAGDSENLLFNPNEIAIVDLEADAEAAVTKITLRSFGAGPRWVEFTPEMELAGERRRLLVVVYQAQLALLDLNHLDRPEYTVELSDSPNVTLTKLRFSAEEQKIYALAQGSSDVYVVPLLPSSGGTVNDFVPSVNQLGADANPLDMAPFGGASNRRLLVVSGGSAQVVDASSSRVTQVPLAVFADHVLLFEGSSPFDSEVKERALLYSPNQSRVSFLDLEDVEARTTRNLEELNVPGGIAQAVRLDENLVLALQASSGVNVLNLQERTASPIQARIALNSVVPSLETGRLWVAPQGDSALGYIDISSLHPAQVNLDLPIEHLLVFNETNPPRVAAVHAQGAGSVSILSAADPGDGKAVTLDGFFFEGALDQ